MSTLRALQGLLGGVNQGLGGFLDNRNQQAEQDNRARITAVQEAEAKRAAQAQEWTQRKQAYDELMGEIDPQTAQPFVSAGLPMVKGPGGGLMRPLGAQEQVALKGIDPEFLGQKAQIEYAPRAADSALDRTHDIQLQGMRAESDREALANALSIAGMNNATSRANTEMTTDARVGAAEATAQAALARQQYGALNKPLSEEDYAMWKIGFMREPQNKNYYNEAIQSGKSPQELDLIMRRMAARARTPLIE